MISNRAHRLPRLLLRPLALAIALVALSATPAAAWESTNPTNPTNPLANQQWFVDWEWGIAQRAYRHYVAVGDHERARWMWKLAREPQTKRFTRDNSPSPRRDLAAYLARMDAVAPDQMTFLYTYQFPHRRCSRFNDDGGVREYDRIRRWYSEAANGIGSHRVIFFLEPDALGTMHCLSGRAQARRYRLLYEIITILNRLPNAAVYLDAAASDWHGPYTMARRLRRAGVRRIRGFFLNSTHSDWTWRNVRHGVAISGWLRRFGLGTKHFVVNTAVNGRGPFRRLRPHEVGGPLECYPPGRALGPYPTVRTSHFLADGYIWIAQPGNSGYCRRPRPGGSFNPEYAIQLAKLAAYP